MAEWLLSMFGNLLELWARDWFRHLSWGVPLGLAAYYLTLIISRLTSGYYGRKDSLTSILDGLADLCTYIFSFSALCFVALAVHWLLDFRWPPSF